MKVRLYDPGCRHPEIAYHQGNVLVHKDCTPRNSRHQILKLMASMSATAGLSCHVIQLRTITTLSLLLPPGVLCRLLSVSILVNRNRRQYYDKDNPPPQVFLPRVHVLEGANRGDNMRWEVRDGRSLGDCVLFLGLPGSFSKDSGLLGVAGACAYFVFRHKVFMYDLIDDDFKLIERMDPEWGIERVYVWLWPGPTIAWIEEIKERLQPLNKGVTNFCGN